MPKKSDSQNPEVLAKRREAGERIRQMVSAIGTHAKAAEVAGVTVQQIGRFISGKNSPSFLPMAKLAKASGMSLDWVSTGEGDPYGKSVALSTYERGVEQGRFLVSFMERIADVYSSRGVPFVDDDECDEVIGPCLERVLDFPAESKEEREELVKMVLEAHSSAADYMARAITRGTHASSTHPK